MEGVAGSRAQTEAAPGGRGAARTRVNDGNRPEWRSIRGGGRQLPNGADAGHGRTAAPVLCEALVKGVACARATAGA